MDIGDKVRLASPDTWVGYGCDVDGVYTVTDKMESTPPDLAHRFGSGIGFRVTPALQPDLGLFVWYDAAHFVPANTTLTGAPGATEQGTT